MICLIRIKGRVGIPKEIENTLYRLRLRKKYSCIVLTNPTEVQKGMIKKVRYFIAFGEINDDVFEKLIEKRGKLIDKSQKIKPKEIIENLKNGKKYEELNLKPFFRLHPPRGGINTKMKFPKGSIGNHKEKINKLLERML